MMNYEQKLPQVCVLMSTYNGSAFLKQQIESILDQTEVNIKLIIRDDGSTDETINLLEQYIDDDRIIINFGENIGAAKSFYNLLQTENDAEYYAFSDQDDFWKKDKLINAIKALGSDNSNEPKIYASSLSVTDQNLNLISYKPINTKRNDFARILYPGIAGCTIVFNRLFKKMVQHQNIGLLNIIYHDTFVISLAVLSKTFIYYDANSYIMYRQHTNNYLGYSKKISRKVKLGVRYIKEESIKKQLEFIVDNYSQHINHEFQPLIKSVINYETQMSSKLWLIFNLKIVFGDLKLRLLFIIKVILHRL